MKRVIVAALTLSLTLAGCAALGDLQKGIDGVKQAKSGWNTAEKVVQAKKDLTSQQETLAAAQQRAVAAQAKVTDLTAAKQALEAQRQALGEVPATPESPAALLDAQIAAKQQELDAAKAELLAATAQVDEATAKIESTKKLIANGGIDENQKFGPEGVSGSASQKAVATFEPLPSTSLAIGAGKVAVVNFTLDRQVILLSNVGNGEARLQKPLIGDSAEYWGPQNRAVVKLWENFNAQRSSAFPGVEFVDQTILSTNNALLALGVQTPQKIMGMTLPIDDICAPGTGRFAPTDDAAKLAKAAELAGADWLLLAEAKAHYGIFDGNVGAAKAQMQLDLTLTLVGKDGKQVAQKNYRALSQNRALLMNDDIYPPSIPWLAEEAQSAILGSWVK